MDGHLLLDTVSIVWLPFGTKQKLINPFRENSIFHQFLFCFILYFLRPFSTNFLELGRILAKISCFQCPSFLDKSNILECNFHDCLASAVYFKNVIIHIFKSVTRLLSYMRNILPKLIIFMQKKRENNLKLINPSPLLYVQPTPPLPGQSFWFYLCGYSWYVADPSFVLALSFILKD